MSQEKLPMDTEYQEINKSVSRTNDEWGRPPEQRSIDELFDRGIIILDKPANPTSHECVAWLKNLLHIRQAGHGGTLDPKVTGVLPIALGRSTRAAQVLLPAGKEYICVMRLHGDSISNKRIQMVVKQFLGKIYQRPPVRSSVKRRLRVRSIYYIKILEYNAPFVLLRIGCQAGTYIRKLCHDIGLVLGCGASMWELRRTRTGPFTEDQAATFHEIADASFYYFNEGDNSLLYNLIRPIEEAFKHLPSIYIRDSAVDSLCHGASLTAPGVVKLTTGISRGNPIAIFTLKNEIIALAEAKRNTTEIMKMNRGIIAKPITVLMQTGTYPPLWGK